MRLKSLLKALLFILLLTQTSASIHLPPFMHTSPDDVTYEIGSTEHQIVWQFEAHESNDSPSKYTVTLDGVDLTGHTSESWQDNVDIIVDIDGLLLGLHVVIITVNDSGTDANQAPPTVDSVNINVVNSTEEATTTESTVPLSQTTDPASSSEPNQITSSPETSQTTPSPLLSLPIILSLILISRFKRKSN